MLEDGRMEGWVAVLNRVVSVGILERVTFEPSLKENYGMHIPGDHIPVQERATAKALRQECT